MTPEILMLELSSQSTALREQGRISAGNVPGSLGTPASGFPCLDQLALPGGPSPDRGVTCCSCLRPLSSVTMCSPEFPARVPWSQAPAPAALAFSGCPSRLQLLAAAHPLTCFHLLPSGAEGRLPSFISLSRHLPPQGAAANHWIAMQLISRALFRTRGRTRLPVPRMLIWGPEVHEEHSITWGCVGRYREESRCTDTEAVLSLGDK